MSPVGEGVGEGFSIARIAGVEALSCRCDIDGALLARFEGLDQFDQLDQERRLPSSKVAPSVGDWNFLAVFGDGDLR